jgi:hypothetical protein
MSFAPENAVSDDWHSAEIQPHQHLISAIRTGFAGFGGPESVDAAICALYNTANGGGRNPAAAVL